MTLSYSFTWIIIIIICPLVVRSSITDRFWCNLNWWIKEYNFDRIFDFPWPVSFHNHSFQNSAISKERNGKEKLFELSKLSAHFDTRVSEVVFLGWKLQRVSTMNQFQSNLFTRKCARENIENYCNRVIKVSLGFNSSIRTFAKAIRGESS